MARLLGHGGEVDAGSFAAHRHPAGTPQHVREALWPRPAARAAAPATGPRAPPLAQPPPRQGRRAAAPPAAIGRPSAHRAPTAAAGAGTAVRAAALPGHRRCRARRGLLRRLGRARRLVRPCARPRRAADVASVPPGSEWPRRRKRRRAPPPPDLMGAATAPMGGLRRPGLGRRDRLATLQRRVHARVHVEPATWLLLAELPHPAPLTDRSRTCGWRWPACARQRGRLAADRPDPRGLRRKKTRLCAPFVWAPWDPTGRPGPATRNVRAP